MASAGQSSHQVGAMTPSVLQQKTLEKVVQVAAHSAECSSGFLLTGASGNWNYVSVFNLDEPPSFESSTEDWLQSSLSDRDLVVIQERSGASLPASLLQFKGKGIDFVVVAALRDQEGVLVGALCVCNFAARQCLSAAQTYALKTHAAIASEILQADIEGMAAANKPSIERLRLLESVVVDAKDAILITEAEPIDAPGPRIVYCNPAFLATTGFSLDEVIGMTPRILHCEDR
jgi:PAS domain-containing protein